MKKIFFLLAVLLFITWIIGFFVLTAGMFIHCILLMAVLLYLQGVIRTPPRLSVSDIDP
jgi:Family of unknown function (DUF5670)